MDSVHNQYFVDSVHIFKKSIVAARQRLAPYGVDIRMFPGGHLTTSEHPLLLAEAIRELAATHGVGQAAMSHNQEDQ